MQKSKRAFKCKYLVGVFSILILSFTIPKIENPKTILLDNISTQLEKEIFENDEGCLAFTVIKADSIVYFKSFGCTDKKHRILPDTSTIFRVGSITKSFTAVLMLQLVDEGYFKLDDPVEKYVPEIKAINGYTDSTKITFRQLASHTSGLAREPDTKEFSTGPTIEWHKKILLAIPQTKFALKPNTAMLYSNIGYAILGLAISRAANSSFIKLVTDRIFIPLNMQSSYFDVPEDKMKDLAIGIDKHGSTKLPEKELKGRGWRVPNGGIFSTSADLSKFMAMLMGFSKKKILSDKSLSLIKKLTSGSSNSGYSLGTIIYMGENTLIMGHNGSTPGYRSCYAFDNSKKNGVIILVNFNTKNNLWASSIKILKQLSELDN